MKFLHFPAKVAILLSQALLLIPNSSSQTGTTSLRGTVTDKSHAVVAEATVTLANTAQNFTRDMVTSSSGEFAARPSKGQASVCNPRPETARLRRGLPLLTAVQNEQEATSSLLSC